MTNYYIEKNNQILLFDTDKQKLQATLKFMPQFKDLQIKETQRPIVQTDTCSSFVFSDTESYLSEQLAKAKESKIQEATDKAYSFEEKDALVTVNATNLKTRASGIYHIEGNLTNNIKMSAYASTLDDITVVPWNTKENVNILLNKTACQTLTSLMSRMNAKLWTVDFPTYLAQIDTCETADEVNAINIEYQSPSEVVDINIPPSIEEDSGADTEGDEPSASINDEAAEEVTNEDTTVE